MIKVERFALARGEDGSRVSLGQMALKIREGRLNPWVRSWSMRKIVEAGSPDGERERAEAIYNAVLREKIYVPDPIDAELIAGAACTLESCDGLSFSGGDCDCLVVAFFAAIMSVGIRGYLKAQAVMPPRRILDHVAGGVWLRHEQVVVDVDPATRLPWGKARISGRDLWVDPMSGLDLCEGTTQSCDISRWKRPPVSTHGDFVGVGAGPGDDISRIIASRSVPGFSCPDGQCSVGDQQPARVGLAEGIVEPAKKIEGLDKFKRDIQVELLQRQGGLQARWQEAVFNYKLMLATRNLVGKSPIDAVQNVAGESSKDLWTPEHENYIRTLAPTVELASVYLGDGASGARQVDRVNGDAVVLVQPTEPQIIKTPTGDVAVINPTGPGTPPAVMPAAFFGFEPVLTTIIVIGVAAAVVLSIMAICDTVKTQTARARSKDLQDQQRYLTEKGYTPEQVNVAMAQLADTSQRIAAGEEKSKAEDPLAQFAKAAKFGAVAVGVIGVAVGGAYLLQSIKSIRGPAQAAA